MPYTVTTWVNDGNPPLSAANLNKLTNELKSQATARSIPNTLPTWVDGASPAITDAAPLNEMERVAAAVATTVSLSYTPTSWGAGWTPARNATRLNRLEIQARDNRAAIDALVPGGTPYWEWKATNGKYVPQATVFEAYQTDSHLDPSFGGLSAASYDTVVGDNAIVLGRDPAQRVSLRTTPVNPNATGWVSRQELRTTDGPWYPGAGANYDKATIRNLEEDAMGLPSGFTQGLTRWFAWDYYLPLNFGASNDTFNWSTGWHVLMDLHGNGSQYEQAWNVLEAGVKPTGNPKWLSYHMGAHEGASDPAPPDTEYVDLVQLCDAAGTRTNASFGVWHELVVGVRFSSDGVIGSSTGWIEIWHNGVNLLPQHFRPTCFPNETAIWQQAQNYKQHGTALAGGATSTVVYYGGVRAGLTRADVQRR